MGARTHCGSLLLTGYWTPVAQQPTKVREAIKSWSASMLPSLRMLAKAMTAAAQKANAVASPCLGKLSGYSDVPTNWKAGDGFVFGFVQLDAGGGVHEMAAVAVIGSGCGGGVLTATTRLRVRRR